MEELVDVLDSNGMYTGKTVTREECGKKGLWHKAVCIFIINSKNQVLLQKRSANKKTWPNMWDVTAGGNVLAGEFGFEAVIRELKEELGISINKSNLTFIGSVVSSNKRGDIINNYFNEYFIASKDLDETKLELQEEEVSAVKWMEKEEIIERVKNKYDGITDKEGCWEYLVKYYEWKDSKK